MKFHNVSGQTLFGKGTLLYLSSFVISLLWTSYTSTVLAHTWQWDAEAYAFMTMRLAQVVSVPLMTFLIVFVLKIRIFQKRLIILYLIHLFWFLLLFLSVAPGCLTEDSFYTLHMVKNGWWGGWYSPLHPALMTALIQILPWQFNAPGIFLAILWSLVFVLIHNSLFLLNAPRTAHLIASLLVFLPALVAASLIIIRDSFFTVLFILFLITIFKEVATRNLGKQSSRIIFDVALLGSILIVYRTDAMPSVLLGWLFLFRLNNPDWKFKYIKVKSIIYAVGPIVSVFVFSAVISHILDKNWIRGNTWETRAEQEYKLTLIENPLGYVVKQDKAKISVKDRESVEKVFKISDLKAHYCPANICVFFGGFWNKESTEKERGEAFTAALHIFVENPAYFMKSRLETLEAVGGKNSQTVCERSLMEQRGYPPLKLGATLTDFGALMIGFFKKTETLNGQWGGSIVWWNVYLYLFLCAVIAANVLKTPASSIAALLLLIRTAVVIFAAPAGFTVYYLTLFFGVPLLAVLAIVEFKKKMVIKS